jgi:AAA+ ATPase superfamily predicted ATPase
MVTRMFLTNPYIVGNPVGKTPTFVGRSDILRSAIRVLQNPSQSGLVLFGQRRIGKTSLLEHLDSYLHSNKNSRYATVVFDLQDKAKLPLESVLRSLSETIARSIGLNTSPNLGSNPEKTFRDEWLPAVMSNLSKSRTLALLFDEFDVLADHNMEQSSEAFFPYFREIISLYPSNLKFIFVLGRNITDINKIALAFLKVLEAKHVSLLSESETTKLVRLSETLNNSLTWPDEAVQAVWNLSNGHPYLTQSLCSQVWEALHEGRATSNA